MMDERPILPLFYCGNIAYYHLLWKHDKVLFDLAEPYQKQSYRSRCHIMTANGVQKLTVPVERPNGRDTIMSEVKIFEAEDWRKNHLKAIESAYSRSPYFIYYFEDITRILNTGFTHLYELNAALNGYFIEKIGLSVETDFSHQQQALVKADPRLIIHPKSPSYFDTFPYIQTFEERHGFTGNLSVLDLLFNEGPNSISVISESKFTDVAV